ncbi:MAG: hypothetical protein ACR652_24415 [Methylocystis sp.]|uniref:hypothetical protein n=1 Tax=Methylocystis sp. TaxID=1911079 RepID=UPI003DA1D994
MAAPAKILADVAQRVDQINDPRLSRDFDVLRKHYASLVSRNKRLEEQRIALETNHARAIAREQAYEKEVLAVAEELIQLKRETGRIGL